MFCLPPLPPLASGIAVTEDPSRPQFFQASQRKQLIPRFTLRSRDDMSRSVPVCSQEDQRPIHVRNPPVT